jgi:hypothetical protein
MIIERQPRQVVRREVNGQVLMSTKPATARVLCSCGCTILVKRVRRPCPNCGKTYTPQGELVSG